MTNVLYQLEAFLAARRVLVQAPRALVLAMNVLGTGDPVPDEPQPCTASIAACALAHYHLDRGSTVYRSTRIQGLPYIQIWPIRGQECPG